MSMPWRHCKDAQVGLTLCAAAEKIHREEIFQVMSGVLDILTKARLPLLAATPVKDGLSIAIAVQGEVAPEQVLRNS